MMTNTAKSTVAILLPRISTKQRGRALCLLLLLLGGVLPTARSQIAGISTLSVLDMSSAARTAGLGMDYLALYDNDVSIGIDNPSMIDTRYHKTLTLNYVNLFTESHFGAVSYGLHTTKMGDFLFSLRFDSYGKFNGYTEEEVSTGTFSAADYVFSVGWGRHIDSCFSIGVNFKPVISQYDQYTAIAIGVDVAGSYVSSSKRFASTLMARNIGAQVLTFNNTTESLPFELSASLSYKLKNAPFRFFFAATELQKWNIRYDDPLNPVSVYDPYEGTYTKETWVHKNFDILFRHTLFGVELSLKQAFFLRLGYSYRQMVEMHGTNNLNTSGFSYGFGLRKKKFELSYARNNYHLGQAPNYLTFSLRF